MKVLDTCCGSRMFWFNKTHKNVLYADIRNENHLLCDGRKIEINPDIIIDFRKMPFPDQTFNLVVFDPPHLDNLGENSWMFKKYGKLNKKSWEKDLKNGFMESWRVLKKNGTLIFKWNEDRIKINKIIKIFEKEPLFGHRTTKNLKTIWMTFFK
jgi:ubiquinone/menaquinone biosynthesis C-methylase UbiE